MLGRIFLGDHFVSAWLALHGAGDRELGGIVVVLENLLVVGRFPVNEDATDDAQLFGLVLGNNPFSDGVSDRLGNGVLCGAEHLNRLLGTLDRDLGDHDGCWLHGQIRGQHGQQVAVTVALVREGVGERNADGA